MNILEENFGDFFRRLRRSKGFKSQKELSNASGVSQTTISRIEDGKQVPGSETLKLLAEALKVPHFDLMVLAGHVDENDMLETKEELVNQYSNIRNPENELIAKYLKKQEAWKKEAKEKELNEMKKTPISYKTEKEFLNKLELSDEKLLNKFKFNFDGMMLTEDEAKSAIAYLRILRKGHK